MEFLKKFNFAARIAMNDRPTTKIGFPSGMELKMTKDGHCYIVQLQESIHSIVHSIVYRINSKVVHCITVNSHSIVYNSSLHQY